MAQTRNEQTFHHAVAALLTEFGLRHKNDENGVCNGLISAAMMAALASPPLESNDHSYNIGDFQTFYQRLEFIMKVYQEKNIKEKVESLREKVKAKKEITAEEKLYLEIPAFLQRVDWFFQPENRAKENPNLFQYKKMPYAQNIEKVFFLLQPESLVPKELDKENFQKPGIVRATVFTGMYDQEQLKDYARLLQSKLETIMSTHKNQSIAMALKVINHAIMIAYQNQQWIIFDANYKLSQLTNLNSNNLLPYCFIESPVDMAEKIENSFALPNTIQQLNCFSTEIYTTNDLLANDISKGITELQNNSTWKKMHTSRMALSTSGLLNQKDLLRIAATVGDHLMLKELMKEKEFDGCLTELDIKKYSEIMVIALRGGHEEFALTLLSKPHTLNFDLKLLRDSSLITMMDIAKEKHLQSVMIRMVECRLEKINKNAPNLSRLMSNVLSALSAYINITKDPTERREKAINKVIDLLDSSREHYVEDEKSMKNCKEKLEEIINEIREDHTKQFPTFIPTFFNRLYPSRLADYLNSALAQSPITEPRGPRLSSSRDNEN